MGNVKSAYYALKYLGYTDDMITKMSEEEFADKGVQAMYLMAKEVEQDLDLDKMEGCND